MNELKLAKLCWWAVSRGQFEGGALHGPRAATGPVAGTARLGLSLSLIGVIDQGFTLSSTQVR